MGNTSQLAASRRHGATAVEAAIVLPVITILLLMCADLGRVIHAQIVVTNAVRTGAEYGARHRFTTATRDTWEDRIVSAIEEEIASIQHSTPGQVVAEIETTQVGTDDLRVQVSATYPFQLIVAWPGFPPSLDLAHSVTMRQYQ